LWDSDYFLLGNQHLNHHQLRTQFSVYIAVVEYNLVNLETV